MTRTSGKVKFLRSSGRVWALIGCALTFVGLACSSEGYGPLGGDDAVDPGGDPSVGTPCEALAERACGLTLEVGSETMTCYRGTQVCEGGVWSTCRDGQVTRESLPGVGFDPTKRRVFADPSISDPAACGNGQTGTGGSGTGGAGTGGAATGGAGTGGAGTGGDIPTGNFGNPCDPGCMRFSENPVDINANGGASSGPPPSFPPRGCGQSLCVASNGAIDKTCDPCATGVISRHPSCEANWTSQCVFWATSECNGSTPPTNVCDFGLLSDGNLTVSNRASANASIGAYGNLEIKAGASTFGSVYALGNVDIRSLSNAPIDMKPGGGIFANGYIKFQSSGNSNITGNLFAGTSADLEDVNIFGDVWAGTNITASASTGAAEINGKAYAIGTIASSIAIAVGDKNASYSPNPPGGPPPLAVTLPPKTGPAPGTAVPILPTPLCPGAPGTTLTGSQTLTPGVYGAVNASTLELDGQGTYYFYSLKVATSLVLNAKSLPYSTGFDVRVCNAPVGDTGQTQMFGSGVKVTGKNGAANDAYNVLMDPKYLTLFYKGTLKVKMEVDVFWTGIFMAPNAMVEKGPMNSGKRCLAGTNKGNSCTSDSNCPSSTCFPEALPTNVEITSGTRAAPVNGAIWAKEVSVEPNALTRAINADDCKAIAHLPIVNPPACPLTDGTPGLRDEPCTSGQDCQANSRCFRPKTSEACGTGRSKCTPNAAPLSATCDDCVARICKVDPNCCSAAWTQACVDKVATVCDAVCQQGNCTQNVCAAGAQPIDKACDDDLGPAAGCIDKVCATIPSCCTTAWTSACVNELMKPSVCGSISAGDKRLCDLAIYAKNTYDGAGSTVVGLTGTAATLDPDPSYPSMGVGFFDCKPGTTSHNPGDGNLTLYPLGHANFVRYNVVHLGVGESLSFFGSGSYYMNELTTDGNNTITFPSSSLVYIDILVCGKVTIGADSRMDGFSAMGANSMRVRFYSNYSGPDAIWLVRPTTATLAAPAPENTRYGALFAPFGEIRVGRDILHYGSAWAQDVRLTAPASVYYSSAAETGCESYLLDDGPTCPMKLIPTPATETGKCVDNKTGYQDPACVGYDLALGTPCMTGTSLGIPVCNHGTAAFSGALQIARYAENLGQLAIDEPTVPPSGTLNQSVSVAAGACATVNWNSFPAGRFTLMLDPSNPLPKQLNECNNHRLDNWSASDGRTCIPYGQPKTVEYEYEAECPKGATARWGLLTWNTTTPGDSKVVFSLKAGLDDAELNAATYVEVGRAQMAPVDTQVCIFKSAPACYADVAAKLNLGKTQGQKLSLKVDLLPGTGSPVLRDWGISYSCIYDE